MWGNNNLIQSAIGCAGQFRVVEEEAVLAAGYITDYRATLQAHHQKYLGTLRDWLQSLGLKFRSQVSYNMPMDMAASVPLVDAPEAESLGFEYNIDAYRQYTGTAIISGKHIISNEMGAVTYKAYQYPVTQLLYSRNAAFASNTNKVVLHGQSYTGKYYGTTWPGYTAFQYIFFESYSHKLPARENGLADTFRYLGRTQWIQQSGTPRVDDAIYHKTSVTELGFPVFYNHTDLSSSGKALSPTANTHDSLACGRVLLRLPNIRQPQTGAGRRPKWHVGRRGSCFQGPPASRQQQHH
jgi:hypothetical protein